MLYVAGVAVDASDRFVVTRVQGGVQDAAFGSSGWHTVQIVGTVSPGAVLAEPSGHVMLVAVGASASKVALARMKADGNAETSFGTSGIVQTTVDAASVAGAMLQESQVVVAAVKAGGESVLVRYWR